MGCSASAPEVTEAQSYLKPFQKFHMSFYAIIPNATAMKRIHDYAAWEKFLVYTMQESLQMEWSKQHGSALPSATPIPCRDIEIVLMKVRRSYSGKIAWKSLECDVECIAESVTNSVVNTLSGKAGIMYSLSIHPIDLWSDPAEKIEHAVAAT